MKIDIKSSDTTCAEVATINDKIMVELTVSYLWDDNGEWHHYLVISGLNIPNVYYRVITNEIFVWKISDDTKIKHIKKALKGYI